MFSEMYLSLSEETLFNYVTGNSNNPFRVVPSYAKWAPWIGPRTRDSALVLNTEYAKIRTSKPNESQADIDVPEERLSDELMKLKVILCLFFNAM